MAQFNELFRNFPAGTEEIHEKLRTTVSEPRYGLVAARTGTRVPPTGLQRSMVRDCQNYDKVRNENFPVLFHRTFCVDTGLMLGGSYTFLPP
jgi:hypothetical protein